MCSIEILLFILKKITVIPHVRPERFRSARLAVLEEMVWSSQSP